MGFDYITPPEGLLEAIEVLDEGHRFVRELLGIGGHSAEAELREALEAFSRKHGRRAEALTDWIDRTWRGRRRPGRKPPH